MISTSHIIYLEINKKYGLRTKIIESKMKLNTDEITKIKESGSRQYTLPYLEI